MMQTRSKHDIFKVTPELGRAYKALFRTSSKSCCYKCGNDSIDELGIYPSNDSNHEWRLLCFDCYKDDK